MFLKLTKGSGVREEVDGSEVRAEGVEGQRQEPARD